MTTSWLVGLVRRHWALVTAVAVLGAVSGISLALFVVTPSYSASVKFYVSGNGASADDQWASGEYARTHVASYTDMIDSNEVLVEVRENLRLPQRQDGSYRDLADNISALNPLETSIIDVTVEDSSPQRAREVAAAIGQVFNSVVARLEGRSSEEQSPVRIAVATPPALPTSPDSPSKLVYAAAGLLGGLVVGLAAAWLLESRRTRQRRLENVEADGDPWASWHWSSTWEAATSKTGESVEVPNGSARGARSENVAAGTARRVERTSADA